MDDTFANQSGIPMLPSLEDIPVHSTPIKGTKIPLPSTRHPVKKPVYKHRKDVPKESDFGPVEAIKHSEGEIMPGQGHNVVKGQGHDQRETMQIQREDVNGDQGRTTENVSASEFIESNRRNVRFSQRIISDQDEYDASPQFVGSGAANAFQKHLNEFAPDNRLQRQNMPNSNADIRFESGFSTPPRAASPRSLQKNVHNDPHRQTSEELKFNSDNKRPHYQGLPKPDFQRNFAQPENEVEYVERRRDSYDVPYTNNMPEMRSGNNDRSRHLSNTNPCVQSVDMNKAKETNMVRQNVDTNNYSADSRRDNSQAAVGGDNIHVAKNSQAHRGDESPSTHRNFSFKSPTQTRKSEMTGKSLSDSFNQTSFSDVENTTLHKQRQEIQLLVTELRARDQELGDTLRSHQQQLMAWEQDRQRLLTLDQKCSQHQEDLQHKSSQLCNALASLKALKSKHTSESTELETMRGKMENVTRINDQLKQELKQQMERSTYLQKTIDELSTSVGRSHAREEELSTSLKLKEKDIVTATGEMRDLGERLRLLDQRCKECQDRERDALKERSHWKHRHDSCVSELQATTDQITSLSKDKAQLSEENRSLRQNLAMIQKDAGMREKCKDEIIDSMKAKQERTDAQLKNLRELYERQLREVSILHLHLDTSKDIINKQQSSLEEQQFSASYSSRGNSVMSDPSTDHMFPGRPHHRPLSPTHSHHYKDFEPSLQQHTQSSGYQTQTSGNQSELTENQTNSSAGYQSMNPHSHTAAQQGEGYQSRLSDPFTRSTSSRSHDHGSPNSAHSRLSAANCENRFSHKPESATNANQRLHCASEPKLNTNRAITNEVPNSLPNIQTGEEIARKNNSPRQRLSFSPTNSRNRKNGRISPTPKNSIQQSEQGVFHSDSPKRVRYIIKSPIHLGGDADRPLVANGGDENLIPSSTVDTQQTTEKHSAVSTKEELDSRYAFENKLCAFLEEIDDIENINDSIWDEKSVGNQSENISQVESSPGSKLQKLLLESQMMIQSLESGRPPLILEGSIPPTNKSSQQSLTTPDSATQQATTQES